MNFVERQNNNKFYFCEFASGSVRYFYFASIHNKKRVCNISFVGKTIFSFSGKTPKIHMKYTRTNIIFLTVIICLK